MNQLQISCFLAAAQADSFAQAADSLYLSAPTFGRHISSLEKELGFPLFLRGWKNCNLTPAGEIMYEGFLKMREDYRVFLGKATAAATSQSGHLSIGMLEGQLIDETIRAVLQMFQETYPGYTLELQRYSFHGMMESLDKGKLDVGITLTVEAKQYPDLDIIPLYEVRNEVVLSTKNPLAQHTGLRLKDFAGETFIEIEQSDSAVISSLMTQSCREAGFEPKIQTVPDLKSQILAVVLGQGVAAFNLYHQTYHHPSLVHIPVPELPSVEFCAAWSTPVYNPAVTYLINLFQGYLC